MSAGIEYSSDYIMEHGRLGVKVALRLAKGSPRFVSCIRTGSNAVIYRPGVVSVPPSADHGPLAAFEALEHAVAFVGDLWYKDVKGCLCFWCKYIPSLRGALRYKITLGAGWVYTTTKSLPPGTVLCDAIVLMRRVEPCFIDWAGSRYACYDG